MRVYSDRDLVAMLDDAGYEHVGLRRTGPGGRDQLVTARKPAGTGARTGLAAGSRV